MAHHIVPPRTYYIVFAVLLVLLVLTVVAARIPDERLNTIVAMTIAISKAVLIILFFMHVKYSSACTKAIVCAGFLWLAILVVLLVADYETRHWQVGLRLGQSEVVLKRLQSGPSTGNLADQPGDNDRNVELSGD